MRRPPSPLFPLLFLVLALLLLFTPFSAAAAAAAAGAERTNAVVNEDGSITNLEDEGKEEGQRALKKLGALHALAVLHFLR
jgi:hypothetical protein